MRSAGSPRRFPAYDRQMADLKSALAWSALVAGAAVAAERAANHWRQGSGGGALDWDLVRRTAYSRAGEDRLDLVREVGDTYQPLVQELVPLLALACGTGAQSATFGAVRVVGRRGFVDQNLAMMQRVIGPLEQMTGGFRSSPMLRLPTSLYLGTLLGYIGRRVLGQYDPVLSFGGEEPASLPSPALLMVEPNVRDFQERAGLPLDSLRRWLMLHELTHAWQFELHPWLAPHLTSLVAELARLPRTQGPKGLEELLQAARQVRPQLAAVGRIQAVMALLEGHANYIMREVGQRHLADFETLDQAFHRRQEQPTTLERLLLIISGVALKLQQYQQGERFLRQIREGGGEEALARVWAGPESLPSWGEVRRPERWLERMGYQRSWPGWPAPQPA